MRGGIVPPALLFAALACALAFAPRRLRLTALLTALVAAFGVAQLPLPSRTIEIAFLGCWVSVVATAALVHRSRWLSTSVPLVVAANAGAWSGATIALTGTTLDLAKATLVFALLIPGVWLVAQRRGVAVKVVSSWLIAIAVLAAVLPLVPTPGYAPDHMQ